MGTAYSGVRTTAKFVQHTHTAVLYKLHGSLGGYLEQCIVICALAGLEPANDNGCVTLCQKNIRFTCSMQAGIAQTVQRLAKD